MERDDAFFRTLVELMPQMVWTKYANGRNDYCNARFLDFMNITFHEFIDNSWIVAHPDDVPGTQARWQVACAAGITFEAELRLRPRGADAYRWFLMRAVPHRDASGRVDKWFGTTTDIDAQRRAFAALEFLAESSTRLAGAHDVPAVLDRLAHAALDGLADISIFDLEDDGRFVRFVVSARSMPPASVAIVNDFGAPEPGDAHPIARVMATGRTAYVAAVDDAYVSGSVGDARRRAAWQAVGIRSLVCAPMNVPGRVIGALTLLRAGESAPFTTADVKVVEEVARRAGVAIDAIRLSDRDLRYTRDLQVFADLGESIAEAVGVADTLDAAMRTIVPLRADWAYITLFDEAGDLRVAAVAHPDAAKHAALAALVGERYLGDASESVTHEVVRTRAPVFRAMTDYAIATRAVHGPVLETLWRTALASFVVVPLFSGAAVRGTVHLCMSSDARTFAPSDIGFFQEFARRLAPAVANAELFERERRVARSFQDAALPATLPAVPGLTFDAIYEAGRAEALVGGDWFDAFALVDGRIVVSIGDVAGSGLSAAVTMASVRQAIRGAAHVVPEPSVMLDAADRALHDAHGRFVTAFVGVIDPLASTIVYQSAGHPPALLALRDDRVIELPYGGAPLGLHLKVAASPHVHALPPGSLLVLYTDGLIESTHDILDGEARLRATLRDAGVRCGAHPAQAVHDAMLVEGSRDDVAILTVAISETARRPR